jgi:Rab GDP dissociation inhibitor
MFSSAKMAVCKVPANDMEALKSSLMSLFEKKRVIGLYKYINAVNFDDNKTWDGINIKQAPM